MQSNPMELIETNPVFSELGIGIRLNSRRREARGVPPTCVITHWKPTNGNVFTNVIHPHNNQNSVSQRLQLIFELLPSILGLNFSSNKVAPAKSVLATICCAGCY